LFRKVTGQSPAQYLMIARLRAAANDLLTTHAPVAEIALKTGSWISRIHQCQFPQRVPARSPTHWRVR